MVLILGASLFGASAQDSSTREDLRNFSLEHRPQNQINPEDSALIASRADEIVSKATFYGYDMSAAWTYEQSVCPLMPDTVMLRYFSKDAAGSDSLFVAIVPRSRERVRIVPVLNHGTTRFKPAAGDPRNFQLFRQLVPADVAKENSNVNGKWLLLSACYAEMTGGQPQFPRRSMTDAQLLTAPAPVIRVGQDTNEVSFAEPHSASEYDLWQIRYNSAGEVVSAGSDRRFVGKVTVPGAAAPPAAAVHSPSSTVASNTITSSTAIQARVIPPQAPPDAKVIPPGPQPRVNVIPPPPPPRVTIIPASHLQLPQEKTMPQ